MAILIKFFEKNQITEDETFTFTSALTSDAGNLFDNNLSTKLISDDSDDSTPEVWIFEWSGAIDVDAIHLAEHNIKSGDIKYWDGGAYVNFSTPISLSNETVDGHFFSFDSVNTTKIRVTMNTTQTVDAEKSVGQLRVLEIIGTVEKNPVQADTEFPESSRIFDTSNKGNVYTFFGSKYKTKLKFTNATTNDLTLLKTLKDGGDSFNLFLNGGNNTFAEPGFRVKDMFLVNYVNPFKFKLIKGLHGVGVQITLDLREI